ncbi:hypothetical protein GCM10008111_17640 [Alishewanella tabrizica]|uniref:histidine kinase n=1 Tax=Alishewanella tabrizica TaxID=671278 RepID=A0ABQ2WPU8_9ALTE|nr:hypothetical protein GCM10008111_17640 [Alishewanella tabrizica]
MLIEWFQLPSQPILLDATYDAGLVLLSLFIAIFSSGAALFSVDISRQHLAMWQKQFALLAGTVSLGIGIWSMHFVGMLAFELCTPVEYAASVTLFSLLPSLLASWVALNLLVREQITLLQLLTGGILVGAGIGAMHYSGMAAMQMAVQLRYDPLFFTLSILVAVVMAFLALWVRFGVQHLQTTLQTWQLNALSGTIMGLAISAMHYTGMLAARFVAPVGFTAVTDTANSQMMALIVTSVTVTVTLLVLLMQVMLKLYNAKAMTENYTQRLSSIMDTVLDAILTVNSKGEVVEYNHAALSLFEENASLTGKHFSQLLTAEYAAEFENLLSKNIQQNHFDVKSAKRHLTVLTTQGKTIPVRMTLSLTRVNNEPLYVASLSDISAQIAFEQSLKENEQKFRSLIANIPGAAYRCLKDDDWTMIFISERVEVLCGYPASDFMLPAPSRSWAELILVEDRERAALTATQHDFSLEYRILHKDGSIRWMLEHGDIIENDAGEVTVLDGFIMDITERRQMEEQLRQAKQLAEQATEVKSAFLANMSHEIRTPLNAVIGFTDLLLENPDTPDASRYIQTVNHSARALLVLLNDILDSAKLEKGKLELEAINFNLTELVDNVVSTLWVNARKKHLALNFTIHPTLAPYYFGAAPRIRQVLLNILGNAIKFTEQGSVTLTVYPIAEGIAFEITDTGIGIAKERLASIFEPFTQADASMSRRFGGTGLGTTISKQLIELMGGTITATSKLGEGSTFVINLPLAEGEATNTLEKVHKLPPLHFLIADDIPQNLELLTAILQRDKHHVTSATNGEEVLKALQERVPDIVLLDVQMPIMDGLTAATRRREYEAAQQLARVPIVALTASALAEDRLAVIEAGMDGFATKPIDTDTLFAEIARVLNIPLLPVNTQTSPTELAIVDVTKGEKLWGSQEKFYAELQRFANGPLQHLCQDILTAEAQKDLSALKRIAHSYKGLTGNLSLMALANSCLQLENAITTADEAQLTEQIKQLCFTAEHTRKMINTLHTPVQQPITDKGAQDLAHLAMLLRLLNTQLQTFNYDDVVLRELRQYSQHPRYADAIGRITHATESFDFEQAHHAIAQLVTELER